MIGLNADNGIFRLAADHEAGLKVRSAGRSFKITEEAGKMRVLLVLILTALTQVISGPLQAATTGLEPTPMPELDYAGRLLDGSYDPAIPEPASILGFPVGERTATPEQIAEAVLAWSAASDRAVAVEYARTHENRPLYYVMISSPENLSRLADIQADIARLARPAGLSEREAEAVIDRLPATAWMAYSIHGNESSGADAALAVIYHLVASTDEDVLELLEKEIIFIDPSQNPDGRARFVRALEQNRGAAPNVDSQSLLHSGFWPYGRTNHYFFDLNRDFYFLVHPETRGRVAAINDWYPQIIIDGHEMGSSDTFLLSPAREPINRNLPAFTSEWANRFAQDLAAAFDQQNWPYYHGEWNDNLYAGYSSYAMFRGSLFILYEQASTDEDGIRLPNGMVRTYRESVHHQMLATMSNLESLARNSKAMYRDFVEDRRFVASANSPYADLTYAVLPNGNRSRLAGFAEKLLAQDIEVLTADRDIQVRRATDWTGRERTSVTLPAGSLVIPNRQSEARLIAAILEFDAEISDETLAKERQERLRDGGSIMYDTTAWNLEMMYGLETLRVPEHLTNGLSPYQPPAPKPAIAGTQNPIAWIVDGQDDASVAFAARLLEQDAQVRAIDKEIDLDGLGFSRGSVMVSINDNRAFKGDLAALVAATAGETGLTASGIGAGLGEGVLPDIGGRHFRLLERPQIAVLSRTGISPYSFGTIWNSIDKHLGIRHSHLDKATLGFNDLRRYNVLVMPGTWFGFDLGERELDNIKSWVKAGGTLIAIQGATGSLTGEKADFSSVRPIQDTLADTLKYDVSLQREWMARRESLDNIAAIRAHTAPFDVAYPFPEKSNGPGEDALKKLDAWQSMFMPQGAMLAAQVDQQHWLTFGTPEVLPVLYSNNPVLMSDDRSEAVLRVGVLEASDEAGEARKLGWATIPAGQDLRLRMSGLLWPEAAQRVANSAYLTRESMGHGQVILFAAEPVYRGAALGTNRLLLNALVYGPGLGADPAVEP